MAIRAILYKLLPDGSQPYLALDKFDIEFNWWICEKDWVYLGVAVWTLKNMWIFDKSVENQFDFTVITKEEAIKFYSDCLPEVIEYTPPPTKEEMVIEFEKMFA